MEKSLKLWKWYGYYFFKDLAPIYPVYLLMFSEHGLKLSEISMLLAIWSVPVVLLELPSGLLADHWNRKYILILGGACKLLCFLCWYFANGFLGFAAGFLCWGISEAFCSGASEALLFDQLTECNEQEEFDRYYGRIRMFSAVGTAIACLSGGLISQRLGYQGTLLISMAGMLCSMLFNFTLTEANLYKKSQEKREEGEQKHSLQTLKEAVIFTIKTPALFQSILFFVLVIGLVGILDEYDQMIVTGYGLSLTLVGIWIALRNILEGMGAAAASRLKILFGNEHKESSGIIWMLCVMGAILLLVFALTGKTILLPLYALYYMLMAAAGIIQEEYLQRKIEEVGRSTVHSVVSLMHNLYGILVFSLFAGVFVKNGVRLGMLVIAVFTLLMSFLFLIYRKRKKE